MENPSYAVFVLLDGDTLELRTLRVSPREFLVNLYLSSTASFASSIIVLEESKSLPSVG